MQKPYEKQQALKAKIIKPDYEFKMFKDLKNETITDVFTGTYNTFDYFGLPLTLFITESKYIFILTYTVDEDYMHDMDAPPIEALRHQFVSQNDFLSKWIGNKIQFNMMFEKENLPFIDADAYDDYMKYVNQEKEREEKAYQEKLEYERYLKLKAKFENNEAEEF